MLFCPFYYMFLELLSSGVVLRAVLLCVCAVFPPVLLYQPETPCLLVPRRQSANQAWCRESFIDTSLLYAPSLWLHALLFSALVFCLVWSPTGIVLQTIYLWRHRSLPLVGVVSRRFTQCTPLNLCLNKYLFHSLCIWVPFCWPWHYESAT